MAKDAPKLAIVKKRRKRSTSIEVQLKREAAKIYESGMAQAYNAAVGQMLIRKLDEVLALAAVTGYSTGTTGAPPIGLVQRTAPPPPPVEHPCTDCGKEGVYRTRLNQFNPTGSWYCKTHEKKGKMIDGEDRQDRVLLGAQAPVTQAPPAVMVPQVTEPTVPAPTDGLLAAMGMAVIAST